MAKSEVRYLIASATCGAVAIVFLIVCFATENWVTSKLNVIQDPSIASSDVNYGLFFGNYMKVGIVGQNSTFQLTLACYLDENVCAWSCLSDADERSKEVEELYESGTSPYYCKALGQKGVPDNIKSGRVATTRSKDSSVFVNAGMWISTLTFMSIALLFAVIGSGFTIFNIFNNPIGTFTGIIGLYIWFSISVCSTLLVLILWGSEFGIRLSSNIAIADTIEKNQMTSKDLASLGYSYFLLIVVEVELLCAICMIYYRQRLLRKSDPRKAISDNIVENDSNAYLY